MLSIRDAKVSNQKVFLRVDYNVPIKNGKIFATDRIKKSLTTINYLLERKTKIIIATHLGKPNGIISAESSTVLLAAELAKMLKRSVFATDHVIHPMVKMKISEMSFGHILILGNLRWHIEEEKNIEAFGRELASYGDVYVNDAFGCSHRAHASIEAITRYLPSYAGFLMESEVTTLDLLLKNPLRPFVLVIGGAKIKDKAPLIKNLAPKVDKILIGGAIANTFLAATGEDMSESLIEKETFPVCKEILETYKDKVILPSDQVKEMETDNKYKVMDIGEQTRKIFLDQIAQAKTVFWNGNLGYSEDENYAEGTRVIAEAISKSSATTVVAGGDTVGFIAKNNLSEGINFISTGGGATLQFLAGGEMPGIKALNDNLKIFPAEQTVL